MDTEAILLANSRPERPGYQLITWRRVGLPVWNVPLDCIVLTRKEVPPIEEFILRSIAAGLRTVEDVAGLLGLPEDFVLEQMAQMLQAALLSAALVENTERFSLTRHGDKTLAELAEITQETVTIDAVYFDGLLHSWRMIDPRELWKPRLALRNGYLELPPFPSQPPDAGPADTDDVAAALDTPGSQFDVLKVLAISGRRERFVIPALALIYESDDERSIDIEFFVDQRHAPEIDDAFARAEGKRKLGIVDSIRAESWNNEPLLSQYHDSALSIEMQRLQLERARLNHAIDYPNELDQESQGRRADISDRLAEVESQLADIRVVIVRSDEGQDILEEAFTTARHRLALVTPALQSVSRELVKTLEGVASRGVDLTIGYASEPNPRARERLDELAKRIGSLNIVQTQSPHRFNAILVDDKIAASGGFPFFGLSDSAPPPLLDDRTYLSRTSSIVDGAWSELSSITTAG